MKAQSVRRLLGASSSALALGLAGVGAHWLLEVRPAATAPPKVPGWIDRSFAAYGRAKEGVLPADPWPVKLADLNRHIVHLEDLMSPKTRVGVWPYVGPVPPPPRAAEPEREKAKPPTGIESLGSLHSIMALRHGGSRGAYRWMYSPAGAKAKPLWLVIGEFLKDPDQRDARGRFRVTRITRPDPDVFEYVLTYDVYDDETRDPVERDRTARFNLFDKRGSGSLVRDLVPPTSDGRPGTPAPPGAPTRGAPLTAADFQPSVVVVSDSARSITIGDARTGEYLRTVGIERMIEQVRTEEARDEAGRPPGIRLVSGISPDSDLGKLDMKPGDVLKSLDGQPTHSRSQAIEIVKRLPRDTASVQAVVERNGRDIVYSIDPRDPEVRKAAGKVKFEK